MSKKTVVSLENINMMILSEKVNNAIEANALSPHETQARLVQMSLRHEVHHFPKGIPFIAVVRHCSDGKSVVYNVKRSKMAVIEQDSISSETNVGKSFKIGSVNYIMKDTINGFPRYVPKF